MACFAWYTQTKTDCHNSNSSRTPVHLYIRQLTRMDRASRMGRSKHEHATCISIFIIRIASILIFEIVIHTAMVIIVTIKYTLLPKGTRFWRGGLAIDASFLQLPSNIIYIFTHIYIDESYQQRACPVVALTIANMYVFTEIICNDALIKFALRARCFITWDICQSFFTLRMFCLQKGKTIVVPTSSLPKSIANAT